MGRHHHFTDAIAYFGLNAFDEAYPDVKAGADIRSRDGSTSLNILPGIMNLTINGQNVALFGQQQVNFFVPVVAPDIQTSAGISLQNHVHSGVQSGGSTTGGPK
jgi:phage baseplate assembly protein gpV